MKFIYPIKQMSFEMNIGYFKEFFRQNYILSNSNDQYLPVQKGFFDKDIWDGLRVGLTFVFSFKHLKK
jgi:hypothetical protein